MLLQGTHGDLAVDQKRSVEAVLRSAERLEREIRELAADYDRVHVTPGEVG